MILYNLLAVTLVMGDLNAALAAQEGHLNLLKSGGVLDGALDIGGLGTMPRGLVSLDDWVYGSAEVQLFLCLGTP